jgi:hypothetical protein
MKFCDFTGMDIGDNGGPAARAVWVSETGAIGVDDVILFAVGARGGR